MSDPLDHRRWPPASQRGSAQLRRGSPPLLRSYRPSISLAHLPSRHCRGHASVGTAICPCNAFTARGIWWLRSPSLQRVLCARDGRYIVVAPCDTWMVTLRTRIRWRRSWLTLGSRHSLGFVGIALGSLLHYVQLRLASARCARGTMFRADTDPSSSSRRFCCWVSAVEWRAGA